MRSKNLGKLIILTSFLALLFVFNGFCQEEDKEERKLVQFSGLVLTADSNLPIPYATVKIKKTYRGTMANQDGFFSIVVREKDIVQFSAMGFKKKILQIPKNKKGNKYSILITLETDTITFKEARIYPWPSKEKFKEAFVNLELHDDYITIAKRNLEQKELLHIMNRMGMDGYENQTYALNQIALQATYLGGQHNYASFPGINTPIPLSLLNPMAWAQLIKDIKAGKFKKKDDY